MTRDEIEQKLWADQYHWGMIESEDRSIACEVADAAVAQFRQRYPVDDATGKAIAALLDDIAGDSAFSGFGESMQSRIYEAIERFSPITKPQEPTT